MLQASFAENMKNLGSVSPKIWPEMQADLNHVTTVYGMAQKPTWIAVEMTAIRAGPIKGAAVLQIAKAECVGMDCVRKPTAKMAC